MRFKKFGVLALLAVSYIFFLYSCNMEPPDLPPTPHISFESIKFKEVTGGPDSLIVEINFADGDGDLGLSKNENSPPYHPYDRILEDGQKVRFGSRPGLPPYSCLVWAIENQNNNPQEADTILIERNLFHHNYIIDFYRKRNGEYEEYDWRKIQAFDCGENFYGRFPILNTTGTPRALEGVLRYGMASHGFRMVFRNDTIKLRIQIIDRALNKSNVLETPEFTLNSVTSK